MKRWNCPGRDALPGHAPRWSAARAFGPGYICRLSGGSAGRARNGAGRGYRRVEAGINVHGMTTAPARRESIARSGSAGWGRVAYPAAKVPLPGLAAMGRERQTTDRLDGRRGGDDAWAGASWSAHRQSERGREARSHYGAAGSVETYRSPIERTRPSQGPVPVRLPDETGQRSGRSPGVELSRRRQPAGHHSVGTGALAGAVGPLSPTGWRPSATFSFWYPGQP
jgi:hypothetical protein